MEWKSWINKYVFVQLKSGGYYTGFIIDVDDRTFPTVFLTIVDKYNKQITFSNYEVVKLVEEDKDDKE